MSTSIHPPCWRTGEPCPNPCAAQMHARVAYNVSPLFGAWTGWRMAGVRLVSPHGDWIAPHTLDRLMFREARMHERGHRAPLGYEL